MVNRTFGAIGPEAVTPDYRSLASIRPYSCRVRIVLLPASVTYRFLLAATLVIGCAGTIEDPDAPKETLRPTDPNQNADRDAGTTMQGPPPCTGNACFLAEDIALRDVRLNQGVEAIVVRDGVIVTASERSVPMIAGRPMLVRADWTLEAGFTAREIVAVLTIRSGGDVVATRESRMTISGAVQAPPTNGPVPLDRTFHWMLTAEDVVADMSIAIELLEADATPADVDVSKSVDLAPITDPMVLNVMILPTANDCSPAPEFTDDDKAELHAYLFNLYPVTAVNVQYHEPIAVQAPCGDSGNIMSLLSQLREAEGLGPTFYYQAVFLEDAQTGGGFAWIAGEHRNADRVGHSSWWRYSIGDKWGGIDNVPHEIGHNHGQVHPWNDDDFDGERTNWGFGLMGGRHPAWGRGDMNRLFAPTTGPERPADNQVFGDVLGYDFPYWVSAYTYNKFVDRVRIVTSYDAQAGSSLAPPRRSLHAEMLQDGRVEWSNLAGDFDGFEIGAGRVVTRTGHEEPVTVYVKPGSHDEGRDGLVVPLPYGMASEDIASVELSTIDGVELRTTPGEWNRFAVR